MSRSALAAAVAVLVGPLTVQSQAALIEAPLPSNTYITFDGLQWAWAYPFPSTYPGFDLSYQSQFGWRLPTTAELAAAPDAIDFLFTGANVPFLGTDPVSGANFTTVNAAYISAASDGACATPFFSTLYSNCDWADGNGQSNYGEVWAGSNNGPTFPWSDQLVVRDLAVPSPITGAGLPGLIAACGGVLAWWRRKRKAQAVV